MVVCVLVVTAYSYAVYRSSFSDPVAMDASYPSDSSKSATQC